MMNAIDTTGSAEHYQYGQEQDVYYLHHQKSLFL
jgi:hypothetical protein